MSCESYYREKTLKLVDKLFTDIGDARTRLINAEKQMASFVMASKCKSVPIETQNQINKMWKDLSVKKDWYSSKDELIQSSFTASVKSKRNKSLERYLILIHEEFYRVL